MTKTKFIATHDEFVTIVRICERFEAMADVRGVEIGPRIDRLMDLSACHANGCPLDLDALLKARDFDFIHDVAGITRHIDRDTGRLGDCFLPRFARPTTTKE